MKKIKKNLKKHYNKNDIKNFVFDSEGRFSRRFLALMGLLIFSFTSLGSKVVSANEEIPEEIVAYTDLPDQKDESKDSIVLPPIHAELIETIVEEVASTKEEAEEALKTVEVDEEVVSLEMQRQDVLADRGWTDYELDVVAAVILSESAPLSYTDAYAVASVPMNRTESVAWNYSVDLEFGEGAGRDIYYQIIQPGQFSPYLDGSYKRFMPDVFPGDMGGYDEYESVRELPGYKAVLDCFSSKEPMHDYLNFNLPSAQFNTNVKEQFVSNGNFYYNKLKEKDRIQKPEEKTLTLEAINN